MRFAQTLLNRHTGYDASVRSQIEMMGDTILEPEIREQPSTQPDLRDVLPVSDIMQEEVPRIPVQTVIMSSTRPTESDTPTPTPLFKPLIYCPVCLENHEISQTTMWSMCGHFACDECKSKMTKVYKFHDWFGSPFVGPGAVCPICTKISFTFTKLWPEFRN